MRIAVGFLFGAGLALGCSGQDAGPEWSLNPEGEPPTGTPGVTNPAVTGAPGTSNTVTPGVPVPTTGAPGAPPPVTTTPNGDPAAPAFNLQGEPLFSRAVQLTNEQWARSVRDILRLPDLPSQANSFLRPVSGFTTFVNNERVLEVSNDLRESYQLAAAEVADSIGTDAFIARIDAGTDAATFIQKLGLRAYRRPLTAEETTRYQTLFDAGAQLTGDGTEFTRGAKLVVEAMIQSPFFLYRTELSAAGQQLSGYEVAAKLSLWLRGTTPDDATLTKAANGELDTPEGVAALTETMLREDAATETLTNMHAELFKLGRFQELVKFTEDYDPDTNAELEEASRKYFDRIFDEDLGLREILTGTTGYMGPKMAVLYGLPAPTGNQVVLQDFGAERPGFFSQVPFLTLLGDDSHSDAIHRGLALNMQVMCADLPKPDFAVSLPPAAEPGQTDRQRMEAFTGDGTCGATCHGYYINPLGYAFENFDGLGRLRTMDANQPVDTKASYPFATGMKEFDGATELMDIIVNSDEAHRCYAKNLMSYALQRDIVVDDQTMLDQLAQVSKAADGSLKAMVLGLVKSDAFRMRAVGSTL